MGSQTTIVMAGTILLGVASGMIGTFAVLRRRALTGDVVSHAALPGLCLAFLLFHSRSILVLLSGALVTGLLGAALVSVLRRTTRLREDAIQGTVLSVFYGGGVALARVIQTRYRDEPGADLKSFIIGSSATMVESDVWQVGAVLVVLTLVISLFFKELKLLSFDEQFCRVQGWSALSLDLLLMVLTSVTVVVGLPAVGVVLTAALLIIPAAAARFWTDRLSVMMVLAGFFGGFSGMVGTLVSDRFIGLPTGPLIVLTATATFVISWLISPHRGLLGTRLRSSELPATWEELQSEING